MVRYAGGDGARLAPLIVGDQLPVPSPPSLPIDHGRRSRRSIRPAAMSHSGAALGPAYWALGLAVLAVAAVILARWHLRTPARPAAGRRTSVSLHRRPSAGIHRAAQRAMISATAQSSILVLSDQLDASGYRATIQWADTSSTEVRSHVQSLTFRSSWANPRSPTFGRWAARRCSTPCRDSGRIADVSERRDAARSESTRPKALYAEIDPVDNRETVPPSPGEGGGGPGEIGGTSSVPFVSTIDGTKPQEATRDPVADNLLAEILPNPQPKPAEAHQRALPGPQTTGQGLIPGSGQAEAAAWEEARQVAPAAASVRALSSSAHATTPTRSRT